MTASDRSPSRKDPVSVVLVGIGGMGAVYLQALLENAGRVSFNLVGTVDPNPERCPHLDQLLVLKIPVFKSLGDFYANQEADLAIVSSPIHFHCDQTCLALEHGSRVLCEKPPAATVQEVRRMIEAQDKAKKQVAVGYQWSFSEAIQKLKNDVIEGALGRPRRLRCLYLWPRDEAYYHRNDWAGKKQDAGGRWILDSPANNAMAHDLHNMFYVLGRTRATSAAPARVEAELYRANPIENFDTIALRCQTEDGAEILFFASHAADRDTGPVFSYEFDEGTASVSGRDSAIRADFRNGESSIYGLPDAEPLKKLWDVIGSLGTGRPPACGLRAALSQTLCLNGAQDSMPRIQDFPQSLLKIEGEPGKRTVAVSGLTEALTQCYETSLLPSEAGLPWSRKGRVIELSGYAGFPSAE
jgi:predicted dehydrogenase